MFRQLCVCFWARSDDHQTESDGSLGMNGLEFESKSREWSQLPLEVLILIFRPLDVIARARISRVCKRWNDVIRKCPSISHHSFVDLTACKKWYARKFPEQLAQKFKLLEDHKNSDCTYFFTGHEFHASWSFCRGIKLHISTEFLSVRAVEMGLLGSVDPFESLWEHIYFRYIVTGRLKNLKEISLRNCCTTMRSLSQIVNIDTLQRLELNNVTVIRGWGWREDQHGNWRGSTDRILIIEQLFPSSCSGEPPKELSAAFWDMMEKKVSYYDLPQKQVQLVYYKKFPPMPRSRLVSILKKREYIDLPTEKDALSVLFRDGQTFKTATFLELECLGRSLTVSDIAPFWTTFRSFISYEISRLAFCRSNI